MKTLLRVLAAAGLALSFTMAHAAGTCDTMATEKKLAGAAKTSFLKKCEADAKMAAGPSACDTQAADKKLAGAARLRRAAACRTKRR